MSTHILIDAIEPRTLTIKVRDTTTGEEHPFVLKGNGPWDIDLSRPGHGTSEEPEVAPPPDDEITLRLNCTSEDRFVRVHAIGSGAVAWSQKQAALLGVPWTRDQQGAPHVNLAKKRTLLDDIRKALPGVKVDTSGCHDVDVNPAAVGWHRAAGETKRGERMVVHATGPTDVGVREVKAAKQGGRPEYGTDAMHVLGREAKRGQRIPEEDLKLAELDDLSGKPGDVAPPLSVEPPTGLEPGPGVLEWEPITDNGVPGYAARWKKGTFKLLHVAGEQYALFYEHDGGKGYEMIVCDKLERAKRTAGERMKAIPGAQLVHVVCRQAVRDDEAATIVLDAFSLPGFVAETRKRALDFELAILRADTEEVVAAVTMNDERPVVITWNDDEMDAATAKAIDKEVHRVLALAYADGESVMPQGADYELLADKTRLSIHYSLAGETTSGPLVNVTLQLHMGASDPVLFQWDGVQLYSQNPRPEELLESVFEDVIGQDDVKLLRRLGKFLGRVLPREKFKPDNLTLYERAEDHTLAEDLVVALSERVTIDMNVPEEKEATSARPAEAPANADGPRTAPRVRKEAGTAERGGRTRTPRAPKPPTTTPPPASPAPHTDDTPEAMDNELMTSFTTELDNVLAEDD